MFECLNAGWRSSAPPVAPRKSNAAAVIYQAMAADVQDLSAHVMAAHRDNEADVAAAKKLKAEKVLQARRDRAALTNGDTVSADQQ